MTERIKPSFEATFPNITRWIKDFGTVEIGYDPNTDSFIRAIDEGGMVWSGESHYEYLDDAFQDLETGIRTTLHVPHCPATSHQLRASSPQSHRERRRRRMNPGGDRR